MQEELLLLLEKNKISISSDQLEQYVMQWTTMGMITKPAVDVRGWIFRWRCNRCGANFQHIYIEKCANCQRKCGICYHCLYLGQARSCKEIYLFPDQRTRLQRNVSMQIPFPFTPMQKSAIKEMSDYKKKEATEILLHAVTGAGKTEVVLPLIQQELERGERVLWVIPRKDVIRELAERFREYLPGTSIAAWHGESKETWKDADFVIATSHQCCRFYNQFSLVIVDEVDAFPLFGNKALEESVRMSQNAEGLMIYLTATPSKQLYRKVARKQLPYVLIPQRYHGYPLPQPKMWINRRLRKKLQNGERIPEIELFLQLLQKNGGQALWFLPTIEAQFIAEKWLKKQSPSSLSFCVVHSRDRQRKQKIERFRQGKYDLLLTTTILERGVTLPKVSVLVLGSDHHIFDKAALLQIAGRVGRSAEFQQGLVIFLGEEKTEAQEQAIQEIYWLNHK